MKKYLLLLAMGVLGTGLFVGCGSNNNGNNNANQCVNQPNTVWNGTSCVYSAYGTTGVYGTGTYGTAQCTGQCGVSSGLVSTIQGCLPMYQGNPCIGVNNVGQPVQSQYGSGVGGGYPGSGWGGGGYYPGGGGYPGYGVYPYPTGYVPYMGRNNMFWNVNVGF